MVRGPSCALLLAAAVLPACVVDSLCTRDEDCPAPQICGTSGRCEPRCRVDADCGGGFVCTGGVCAPAQGEPVSCPADMVAVAEAFCVDRYEASRPEATGGDPGATGAAATSRAGVLPWRVGSNAEAAAACEAAGKRLCSPAEWELACRGPGGTDYGYGDAYEPATCNGIDAFGAGAHHLAPTGSFAGCVSGWGAWDLNGNLWEHVAGGDGATVRGGAYNCADSASLHRCGYVPRTWTPTALGFRCCSGGTPRGGGADAGADASPVDGGSSGPDGGGCVEDPDVSVVDARVPDAGPSDVALADTTGADAGAPDAPPGDAASQDAPGADVPSADAPDGHDSTPDVPAPPCPADMVLVALPAGAFCMDRYEASRADATAAAYGSSAVATSRPGVLPWKEADLALPAARAACAAAGKRLCRLDEWVGACQGGAGAVYAYGDVYDPALCNGIDAFCDCEGACAGVSPCPYAHCYDQPAPGGGPCGAALHVAPTGSFAGCVSPAGAYDLNGNLWELTDTDDGQRHFRGGAYNCKDSESLHRCDHDGTWGPSAQGFRCCRDAE